MRRASATRGNGRRASVDLLDTESPVKRFLRRNLVGAAGLGIIAMAAMLAASLATWSVSDPSLNHATGGPVRNALGTPGAVLSDILMQTIGLATAVFLVPLVLWGWRLLAGHALGIGRKRLAYWLIGSSLAAGALAALPVPDSWPLPTGLGGFFGDTVHRFPALITDNHDQWSGNHRRWPRPWRSLRFCFCWPRPAGSAMPVLRQPRAQPAPTAKGHGKSIEEDLGLEEDEGESRLAAFCQRLCRPDGTCRPADRRTAAPHDGLQSDPGQQDHEEDWDEDELEPDYEPEDNRQSGSRLKAFRRALTGRLMPEDDDGLDEFYERGQHAEEDMRRSLCRAALR